MSNTIRDEVVGAELMATRGLAGSLGLLFETLGELDAVRREQLEYWLQDYRRLGGALLRGEAVFNPVGLTFEHCYRRSEHIADGISRAATAITGETERAEELLFALWKPFFRILRQDHPPR